MGSAEDETHDQVLDIVLVGPVPIGTNKFIFQVYSCLNLGSTSRYFAVA